MIYEEDIAASCLVGGALLYNKDMVKKQFKPFVHEDLELKNNMIDFARKAAVKQDSESQLGSAMVYASFAEYITGHLLDNLRHLMYETTYRQFAAIVYVDQRIDKRFLTMGQKIGLLEGYEFPDKKDVMALMNEISASRNNLFHNFAKADMKGLEILEADISNIMLKTEELLTKVNTVYAGLQKVLLPSAAGDSIK